jgi:hypothetical protein
VRVVDGQCALGVRESLGIGSYVQMALGPVGKNGHTVSIVVRQVQGLGIRGDCNREVGLAEGLVSALLVLLEVPRRSQAPPRALQSERLVPLLFAEDNDAGGMVASQDDQTIRIVSGMLHVRRKDCDASSTLQLLVIVFIVVQAQPARLTLLVLNHYLNSDCFVRHGENCGVEDAIPMNLVD